MDAKIEVQLTQQLKTTAPRSVLVIGPEVPDAVVSYARSNSKVSVKHQATAGQEATEFSGHRFDFALVADTVEFMEPDEASLLVGRLRDLDAKLLWVYVRETEDLKFGPEAAISHGLVLRNPENFGSGARLYEFNLKSYKPIPQWLNAKNWANPERWNKARW